MSNRLGGKQGTAYLGTNANQPPNMIFEDRDPTQYDVYNVSLGDIWLNKNTGAAFILASTARSLPLKIILATWKSITDTSGQEIDFLTGNTGGPVSGDANNNINIIGDPGSNVLVLGNPGTNTLSIVTSEKSEEITTNGATPTTIVAITIPDNATVAVTGTILATLATVGASLWGTFSGGARRELGNAILVGMPVIDIADDSGTGSPTFDIVVSGNDLLLQVTGVAAETWSWAVTYNPRGLELV